MNRCLTEMRVEWGVGKPYLSKNPSKNMLHTLCSQQTNKQINMDSVKCIPLHQSNRQRQSMSAVMCVAMVDHPSYSIHSPPLCTIHVLGTFKQQKGEHEKEEGAFSLCALMSLCEMAEYGRTANDQRGGRKEGRRREGKEATTKDR